VSIPVPRLSSGVGTCNNTIEVNRMTYLIMVGCKDPYTAKPFTKLTSDGNMVCRDYSAAQEIIRILNDQNGDGYARLIAI